MKESVWKQIKLPKLIWILKALKNEGEYVLSLILFDFFNPQNAAYDRNNRTQMLVLIFSLSSPLSLSPSPIP